MREGIKIELNGWEMMLVAQAGVQRHVENLQRNRKPAYGAGQSNGWQLNIEGCMGEYALAKYLNIHWDGKGTFRGPDLGDNIEVRKSMRIDGDLILHPKDKDDSYYWHLAGINGTYYIRGFILGMYGKDKKFWKDIGNGRPAFFVPDEYLDTPEQWDNERIRR